MLDPNPDTPRALSGLSAGPCCVQVEPERVNTQTADGSPDPDEHMPLAEHSATVFKPVSPTSAVFPSAEIATAPPKPAFVVESAGVSSACFVQVEPERT